MLLGGISTAFAVLGFYSFWLRVCGEDGHWRWDYLKCLAGAHSQAPEVNTLSADVAAVADEDLSRMCAIPMNTRVPLAMYTSTCRCSCTRAYEHAQYQAHIDNRYTKKHSASDGYIIA